MSKLNKIFFGPAGTGKTRQATIEAVKMVSQSSKIDFKFDEIEKEKDYDRIEEEFKSFSETPLLNINSKDIMKEIRDTPSDRIEKIVNNEDYEGRLKYLTKNNRFDAIEVKKKILEYKIFPFIEIVTFHPSYSYQDFVEGITVETKETENGNEITYVVKDGIFKKICERAESNQDYNYVLIIDEINRGDISSIFGELFTLIEDDKRDGALRVNLPYSKNEDTGNPKKLVVPKNLYILATMNTVDKSIALIDVALRRRFDFEECMPQCNLEEFKKCKIVDLSKLLSTLNERISILKNEHYQIGHSYFLNITKIEELQDVMEKSILPLLQEYFYDDWKSICAVLNQSYSNPKENKILISQQENKNLFKSEFNDLTEYQNKKIFKLNPKLSAQDIKFIYE